MIFNSLTFLVFLIIVYTGYWSLNRRWQNHLLLVASYVFYGWWNWRFISLLVLLSSVDYWVGRQIGRTPDRKRRRFFVGVSLAFNLGMLGYFKYFNFFADSLVTLLGHFGIHPGFVALNVILPLGISFHTFQSLGYTIDVYRGKIQPHQSLTEFMTFVAFFPQLVAGPIERASNLLGQFAKDRHFDWDEARDGVCQMLWGFAQKIIVADSLAGYVNATYANSGTAGGARLVIATYFFAFQLYADFAGYTNIAIGCARLFGFRLMRNFAYPFFSRTISEFWQRWHISLSTWFRDYVFFPLGANRGTAFRVVFNIVLTFTLSGLWHGANWTFVLWGLLNGLLLVPGLLQRRAHGKERRFGPVPELRELGSIVITFSAVTGLLLFFRSQNITQTWHIAVSILTDFDWRVFLSDALSLKLLVLAMMVVEWIKRRDQHPFVLTRLPRPARWLVYNATAAAILLLGNFDYQPFIYFQF